MAEREAPGAPAFRFAAPADSAALLKIYGEYLDTPITFECALPSEAEFAGRIAAVGREYPYLVCLEKGRIVDRGTQRELLSRCPLYQALWAAHVGAQTWAVTSGEKEGN